MRTEDEPGERAADTQAQERLLLLGLTGLGLAHELSSPLTTIGLSLELLAEALRSGSTSGEAAAAQLDSTVLRVRRLGTLIQRFRHFAQGDAGVPSVVALDAIADAVMGLVRPALAELQVRRLHRGDRDEAARALVDPLLLEQAVACLVLNAADALGERPQGAVYLRVARWAREGADEVGIIVDDDGPGFAAVAAASRPGHSTKGSAGMGVGLALAGEIARAAGGRLVLENRAAGGARAVIVLPRQA